MTTDNIQRAGCAEVGVRAYCTVKQHNTTDLFDFSSEDAQERLMDFLTDLRHWAGQNALDFGEADRMAGLHFEAEIAEEGTKESEPIGVPAVEELPEAEARRILTAIFRWMYWDAETERWDPDKEIGGADTVQVLCELLPGPAAMGGGP